MANSSDQQLNMDSPEDIQELKAKLSRLELAMDISRQFSSTLDVNKLMQTILHRVADVLRAEASSFWVKEKQGNVAVCHVAVGPEKNKVEGMRVKIGTGIVGWVMENKQKTVVFDTSKDERFYGKIDEKTGFITKSMLCVPLVVSNECVGAISLLNKKTKSGHFDQDDLEMLEMLAMSGAIAIKNAQLFQSERKIKELSTILNISKEITSTLDLDKVLLNIVNLGMQVIHYKRAVIGLLDANNNAVISAESNEPEPDMSSPDNKQMLAIMKYVMASGKPVHITNFNKENPPKGIPEMVINYMVEFELHCLSVMILADSEGKLGLISMEGIYASLVAANSAYILNIVINQATVAIRNAQLYRSIPTTGIVGKFRSGIKEGRITRKRIGIFGAIVLLVTVLIFTLPLPANIVSDVEIIPDHTTQVTSMTDGVVRQVLFNEGELVHKGDELIILDSSLLDLEKARLVKDRQIAMGELRRLESEGTPFDVRLKRLEIEKMENRLVHIDKELSFTRITAVLDGRILTSKPGELVDKQLMKGDIVASIATLDKRSAQLLLDEEDVLDVRPGDRVSIILQSMPGTTLKGELIYVSHTKKVSEVETSISGFPAYVESDQLNENPSVRFGMTGKAKIHIDKKTPYQIYFKPLKDRLATSLKMMF